MSKAGWRYRRMPGGKCHWEKDINGRVYRLHVGTYGVYNVTLDGKYLTYVCGFKQAIGLAEWHAEENP